MEIRSSGKNESPTFVRYNMHCIENDMSNNSSIVACVFVAIGTCLLSHCLTMIWGNTHTDTEQGSLVSLILFYFFKIGKVGYRKQLDLPVHKQ
jgi:hypothetical protein